MRDPFKALRQGDSDIGRHIAVHETAQAIILRSEPTVWIKAQAYTKGKKKGQSREVDKESSDARKISFSSVRADVLFSRQVWRPSPSKPYSSILRVTRHARGTGGKATKSSPAEVGGCAILHAVLVALHLQKRTVDAPAVHELRGYHACGQQINGRRRNRQHPTTCVKLMEDVTEWG